MKLDIHKLVLTRFPRELIAEVVRFAKPPRVTRFTVELRPQVGSNDGHQLPGGRAYYPIDAFQWSGVAHTSSRRVLIRVPVRRGLKYKRPYKTAGEPGSSGYQGHVVYSGEEALVFLIAHELRHLWQKLVPRGHRVWGSRGRYSEKDADCYALRVVRAWRRRACQQ